MAQVKITVRPNGPFRVEAPEGAIELVDINGNQFDLTGKTAFSLCRCGGSINKPFCDGTHNHLASSAQRLSGPERGAVWDDTKPPAPPRPPDPLPERPKE